MKTFDRLSEVMNQQVVKGNSSPLWEAIKWLCDEFDRRDKPVLIPEGTNTIPGSVTYHEK